MSRRTYCQVLGGLLVAALAVGAVPATAEMVSADFTAGITTTEVDGYAGMAGDGWTTAWSEWKSGSATKTMTLRTPIDGTELKSGLGNYLEVIGGQNGSGTGSFTVGRSFKTVDKTPIDWTKEHTIRFTVRIDEDVDAEGAFTNVEERYQFYERANLSGVPDATSTFVISGISKSTAGTVFPAGVAGEWTFFDGLGTGSWDTSAERHFNTDVALHTGHVYDFEVVVKPETQSYDAAVRDFTADGSWVRAYNLGWRTSATEIPTYLVFAGRDGQTATDNDLRKYSLDAITIVPEPSTFLMLMGVLAAMSVATRGRRDW